MKHKNRNISNEMLTKMLQQDNMHIIFILALQKALDCLKRT